MKCGMIYLENNEAKKQCTGKKMTPFSISFCCIL